MTRNKILTNNRKYYIPEIPNRTFSKLYNPSENLVTDEITVLFKGTIIIKQYTVIPRLTSDPANKFFG